MDKKIARIRRRSKVRQDLSRLGVVRLVVHRTLKHIYAQVISRDNLNVLVSASTVEKVIKDKFKITGNKVAAYAIGQLLAERALKQGIINVSFDRSGFKYHGRVRALAEGARKFGMKF